MRLILVQGRGRKGQFTIKSVSAYELLKEILLLGMVGGKTSICNMRREIGGPKKISWL